MYSLAIDQKTKILHTLVEGNSIRSAERLIGHHRDTIMRPLIKAGKKAELVLKSKIKNIKANHIQIDEARTFVDKKNKNLRIDDSFKVSDFTKCPFTQKWRLIALKSAFCSPI